MEARSETGFPWRFFLAGIVAGGVVIGGIVKILSDRTAKFPGDFPVTVSATGVVSSKHVTLLKDRPGPKRVNWVAPVGSKLRIDVYKEDPPTDPSELKYHCNPGAPNECWTNDLMKKQVGKTYTYRACVTPPGGTEQCSNDPWVHVDP